MSASTQNRQPPGRPTGGEYARTVHHEAPVSLGAAPGVDAGQVVDDILAELHHRSEMATMRLRWAAVERLRNGTASKEEILAEWLAQGRSGRCRHHADQAASEHPEDHCPECTIQVMADARVNPKPQPVPVSAPPARPAPLHLEDGASTCTETGESSSTTTTEMSGDEQFEAAVRRLFGAPADAKVTVVEEKHEDWSTYTGDYSTEIEVTCGDRKRTFESLSDLTRELTRGRSSEPVRMALRFMRAVDAERPLLQGPAAVYLERGYSTPAPVFGRVLNCFLHGRDRFMDFAHTDGRREYIYFNQVVAIHETDQSSVYEERQPHTGGA